MTLFRVLVLSPIMAIVMLAVWRWSTLKNYRLQYPDLHNQFENPDVYVFIAILCMAMMATLNMLISRFIDRLEKLEKRIVELETRD